MTEGELIRIVVHERPAVVIYDHRGQEFAWRRKIGFVPPKNHTMKPSTQPEPVKP